MSDFALSRIRSGQSKVRPAPYARIMRVRVEGR
jgi:hypothetical protein